MPSIVPLGTLIWHVHVFKGELAVLRAQADVFNKNKLKLTLQRQERLFLQLSIKNKRDCNKVLAISLYYIHGKNYKS